ncbi:hypothetical protein GUJ93_ZPchr0012g19253 [Zizania palustris]|uniref:DOMON domain-containing protein n=1 Tax=Zizania palustris TaxID=103762 RepID=A0A8J6BW82_ZIZPA|nr:hypothetical protein GUJ93_ZPchr0012g19253 [Zizania palustris]
MDPVVRPWRRSLLLLCFVCSSLLLLVSSQTSSDSCTADLSLGSDIPFNTTGLSCFSAWSSQDFVLRFGKDASGSNVWNFVLSAPDNGGYISVGFSPTGRMVGSSAVAGWVAADGTATANQYFLGGTSSGSCPPNKGKLALTPDAQPAIVSKGSRLYLAFQFSGQPLTDVIYAVGPPGTLPGSSGLLARHQDMSIGTITLPSGTSGGSGGGGSPATGGGGGEGDDGNEGKGESKHSKHGDEDGDEGEGGKRKTPTSASSSSTGGSSSGLNAKRRHGVLAVISWGAMIPAGVAMARFLKRFDPLWFYAHAVVQDSGAGRAGEADQGVQGAQVLELVPPLRRPGGRLLGVGNIFYGLSLAKEGQEWSYVYGIFVGICAVVYLVLEEWRRRH